MIDLRPVLYVLGIFLVTLAIAMTVPITFDMKAHNPDWHAFLFGMAVTGFFGILLVLTNKPARENIALTPRQAFLLTSLAWIVIAGFAAIPFCASSLNLTFTDGYFEAMSGLTTTGATVITDLAHTPPGILIWRSLLVWMGGVGIIVMALSVLPMLRVGGMQLFRTEFSERDKHLPKIRQLSASIIKVYLGLSMLCMLGYKFGGMGWFDALAHAMTTLGTGGFSTKDTSFMEGVPVLAQYNATFFMIIACLPFAMMARAFAGSWRPLFHDQQVRGYLALVFFAMSAAVLYAWLHEGFSLSDALRTGTFNVASLISTTGYVNTDYMLWGPFALGLFFFLTCTGGCAGSSCGGLKVYRFQILWAVTLAQMRKLIHPHGVFVPHYNGTPLSAEVTTSVLSFFFMFAATFALVALALMLTGEDFITAMSASITTLANVGPGLGHKIGPVGTFAPLNNTGTWIASAAMLLGRLELFTVLVMLLPRFWRK